jgi:hypothetical protein
MAIKSKEKEELRKAITGNWHIDTSGYATAITTGTTDSATTIATITTGTTEATITDCAGNIKSYINPNFSDLVYRFDSNNYKITVEEASKQKVKEILTDFIEWILKDNPDSNRDLFPLYYGLKRLR